MRRRFSQKTNNEYLIIEVLESGNINFTYNAEDYFVYYRINNGHWTLFQRAKKVPIESGQIIECKGLYENTSNYGIGTFNITSKCKLRGNCLSLIFGDNAAGKTDISNYPCAFQYLFAHCNVVEVDKYFLPATTLAPYCYQGMFQYCSSLVNAPALPATTLASSCYSEMFSGCKKLTSAPVLPATTLAYYCYGYMFYGCTSLNYIKMLATDISASNCLSNWVNGVSPTGTFVKNKKATWDVEGVSGIPSNWKIEYEHNYDIGSDISFHIERIDETLYAKDWMTWDDWVHSKYNTVSALIVSSEIHIYSYSRYSLDTYPNNIIKNGGTYYFKNAGGSD